MAKTKSKKSKSKDAGEVKRKIKKGTKMSGPKIYKGLNEGRMKSGAGRFADRTNFKQGDTIDVQILDLIGDFKEYDQHQFRDGGKWRYVPCGGDGCPLCADDDDEVSKQHYRFSCNVYNHDTKRVEVFEGPKTLSQMISRKFKKVAAKAKGPKLLKVWQNSVWEISKLKTQPVSYEVDVSDNKPVSTNKWEGKLHDIDKNIIEQFRFYFGDDVDAKSLEAKEDKQAKSSLDDDLWDKKKLKKLSDEDLAKAAKSAGVKGVKKMERKEIEKAILKAA